MKVALSGVLLLLVIAFITVCQGGEVCPHTPCPQPLSKENLNYTLWDNVLNAIVKPGELGGVPIATVDYNMLQENATVKAYFENFGWQVKWAKVTFNFNQSEYYSFWINVYNYMAVWMVYSNPCATDLFGDCRPISSIRQIGEQQPSIIYNTVWHYSALVMINEDNGKKMSLDDIEDKLRFNNVPLNTTAHAHLDARVHACIVCASVSCPNLRNRSYTVENLDQEMTESVTAWLADANKGAVIKDGKDLWASPIFLWFGNDFSNSSILGFGPTGVKYVYNVTNFLDTFGPTDIRVFLNNTRDPLIQYLSYNWDLNGNVQSLCTQRRGCFPWWALVCLIVGVLIAILIIVKIVKSRKQAHKYETINEN